jgi:transcriptional regulator with GAF, ATPase, and Fis domain
MPPLRDRRGDIPVLASRFVARLGEANGRPRVTLAARSALGARAGHVARQRPRAPDLAEVRAEALGAEAPRNPADIEHLVYERVRQGATSLFEMKKNLERECIVRALEETNGNITRAAALLGMKRPRLSQLVKEYELGDLGK